MSSLARSLLALAVLALLQAACAKLEHGRDGWPDLQDEPQWDHHQKVGCRTRMFGRRARSDLYRYDLPAIHITDPVSVVKIHDPKRTPPPLGTDLVGEEITLCSLSEQIPEVRLRSLRSHHKFDVVELLQGDYFPTPVNMVMYVTRHLRVVYPSEELSSESGDDYQRG